MKFNACSFVGEQLDGFLEAQVRRREQQPALETSVLSLLQGIWRRINPPGSAESTRARAMTHMSQITLKGHGDLELFLQRLGKGRRDCQGAFNDAALVAMVEEMAYNQLRKALAAGDGAVPRAGKSPTMYELQRVAIGPQRRVHSYVLGSTQRSEQLLGVPSDAAS